MDNISRESSLLSQGTMDIINNMSGVNPMDFFGSEIYFKQENVVPANECLQQDISFSFDQVTFPFEILPDSTEKQAPSVPLSTCATPSMETYLGPCEFDVEFNKIDGDRAKWEYSKSLNKLYVVMGSKVPVKFKWNLNEYGLCVRALPVFLAQDYFTEPVQRCPSHASTLETSNKDFPHVDHVIRCLNDNAQYEKNADSKRLSVTAPMEHPQPGTNWSTIIYSFMCKNSCSLGMNRRATAVIFTLERANGEVIGRKLINIRICSCPRRDMGKDENDFAQKAEKAEKFENVDENVEDNKDDIAVDEESTKEPENGYLSNEGKMEVKKVKVKKPLKRLSKPMGRFTIRTVESNFKNFAKIITEVIKMNENYRALTTEEMITLQDCATYLK